MAVHKNLKGLNHAVQHGLWNGTFHVFGARANALHVTKHHTKAPNMAGAVLDFYIGPQATHFVGADIISSYLVDI
jgi:hypothetical protein